MATGILAQSAPSAATNTTVYTVTAGKTASITVSFLNQTSGMIAVRLAIAASGTPTTSEYLEYDAIIPANSVLERGGIVATAAKNIVVYASAAGTSVSVYGYEE